jgi:hypothetical protein
MFATDLDGAGENGLVFLRPIGPSNEVRAYIGVVKERGGEAVLTSSVAVNPENVEYVNIARGYLTRERPALFIDGFAGGRLTTEIIYSINGELRNPLFLSGRELLDETGRPAGYLCTDIDKDGIIEIPTVQFFPGYDEESEEPYYITNWNVFENFSIVKKLSGYYSLSDGYCFILPSRWENVVTIGSDKAAGDVVFYGYPSDRMVELMRLSAVREEKAEAKSEAGYSVLGAGERFVYMYKLPAGGLDEPLILTNTEIFNNFYIFT